VIDFFLSLTKKFKKKRTHHKTKPKQKKSKKTQNPYSLSLFTFVVFLHVNVGVVIITILLLCSRKLLLSYVPPCHENRESIFITNPPNGTVTGLPTRPLYIEMELEPFFSDS
jgi:hypothetical protein